MTEGPVSLAGLTLAAVAALGWLVGRRVRARIETLGYRRDSEQDLVAPGSRWWLPPVVALMWALVTWRLLWAPSAQVGGVPTDRVLDPGASAGAPSLTHVAILVTFLVLAVAGVALAAIDADVHRLPDRLMWPTWAVVFGGLSLAALLGGEGEALVRTVACGALAGLFYLLLSLASIARGALGLGLGDVKLAVVLGAALGWFSIQSVVLGLYAGFVVGGVAAALLLLTRRVKIGGHLPFGPPMMIGALLALLLPPDVVTSMF